MKKLPLTRRGLLIGAAAGGGLLVAWGLSGQRYAPPLQPGKDEVAFDAWIKIATDGVVTVAVPQLEMGQGITTLLPQIVATELGADWRQMAVEPAPISGAYANLPLAAHWAPLWMPRLYAFAPMLADDPDDRMVRSTAQAESFMATADGFSLAAYEQPCREAAASARALLAMAAAARWGVAWEECEAANGFVLHNSAGRLSFAELADEAAHFTPPSPPPLRPDPAYETASEAGIESAPDFPRLDLPAKVDGTYLFAGDVRLPGMVYAAIRHAPMDKGELVDFSPEQAGGIAGLVKVVKGKRWLAAVAESWWAANQALNAMGAHFKVKRPVDSATIKEELDNALRHGKAQRITTRGKGDATMGKPDIVRRYHVAPATHGGLETASVTARLTDGRLELWMASQAPELARRAAARALGLPESKVVLYPMPAGGSFDRRLEHDHAIEAALIAREAGLPVQLIWSRWQEHLAGRPRPPVAALLSAKLGEDGDILTWRSRIACPPAAREFGKRLFDNMTSWSAIDAVANMADPLAVEGAMPLYAISDVALDHVPVSLRLPAGRLRGNAHGYTAFFTECFVDELARSHEREPLSFRIGMLNDDPRMVACLQQVARLGEWDGGTDQSGQGLACHRIERGKDASGRIAAIATARRGVGGVQVNKIVAVVDIGRIINLDIARQQVEGGLLYGLGLALGSSLEYARGLAAHGRIGRLGLPTLADAPQITVEFISSQAEPFDPGELGVAVAAPAIANALFSATGQRLRSLPLLSGGL